MALEIRPSFGCSSASKLAPSSDKSEIGFLIHLQPVDLPQQQNGHGQTPDKLNCNTVCWNNLPCVREISESLDCFMLERSILSQELISREEAVEG